jgi:LysR family glycine cleavage system transcriptional activator
MDHLPPLNAVRVFEAAARHLNFSLAAEALHVTPSAVSHAVKSLEQFLGTALFHRDARGVSLTPAGQAFLPPIRDALDQVRQAARSVALDHTERPLTVSAAPALAVGWLIPRLGKFQLAHPDIDLRLSAAMAMVDLHRSDIDVAIRTGGGDWPGLTSHFLMAEALVALCSPALTEGPDGIKAPQDLTQATLIHELPRLGQWRSWFNAAGVDHPDPERGPKLETSALAVDAAISGLGVALANKRFVAGHLAAGRLVIPFDVEALGRYDFYLAYPSEQAEVPRIAAFRDWLLVETAAERSAR